MRCYSQYLSELLEKVAVYDDELANQIGQGIDDYVDDSIKDAYYNSLEER